MNKKSLTEADIRTKFITPAIEAAGWDKVTQMREEYYITAGRINLLEAVVAELTSNEHVSSANGASHPSLGHRPRKTPVHIVFSTKDRAPVLDSTIRPALHAYLATVARGGDCECYRVGGVADHVHLAVRLSRTVTTAKLVEELKTSLSKWLKTQSAGLAAFSWQRGYGAFSVGPSDLDVLRHYIDTQEEHHRTKSFQDEYRAFLMKYGVEFDERYVWD